MNYITFASISILCNGGKMNTFKPQHRVRQRDPLSPFIFIMCMEFLRALIHQEIELEDWTPIKTSKYGPSFSRLFFVDDVILSASASWSNAAGIKKTLDLFQSLWS